MRETKTYTVWRRHSDREHLDGFVGASAYAPYNDQVCTFTVLFESDDWDEALHVLLTERHGDDVVTHKQKNCAVCWAGDPELI